MFIYIAAICASDLDMNTNPAAICYSVLDAI